MPTRQILILPCGCEYAPDFIKGQRLHMCTHQIPGTEETITHYWKVGAYQPPVEYSVEAIDAPVALIS